MHYGRTLYDRDDGFSDLSCLFCVAMKAPSMHLGSPHVSVSSDRSNVGQEYKGAFPDMTL